MAVMKDYTRSSNSSANHVGHVRHRRHSPEVTSNGKKASEPSLLINDQNKYKSMLIRTYSSVWMIGGFALVLYMGHLYIWVMVVMIQIFMARELFNLLIKSSEERHLPGFRLLNWYFFFTAMLFTYGRFLSRQAVNTVTSDTLLYKSSFTVANIFEGMFWFLLPALLIVINDIAAYLFGFFGKTPLIKLSPKKTWEGFIGASVTTIFSAFLLANVMGRFQWLTCPRKDLLAGWLHCDRGPMFKPQYYSLGEWMPQWFPWKGVVLLPVQWHALALGLFASIIAPFGGFFASGFKRAFKIKMVMAVFAYIYHQSFIAPQNFSIQMILDQIVRNLTYEEQTILYQQLREIFHERQIMQS